MCVLAGFSYGLFRVVQNLRAGQGGAAQALIDRGATMLGRESPVRGSAEGGGAAATGLMEPGAGGIDASRRTAIVRAAERVGPATVSISVTSSRTSTAPRATFPSDEYFERFFRGAFPDQIYEEEYRSLGSGVIVDPDGYVLTNAHVVANAEDVKVTLPDGRKLEGRVLGSEEMYDLAVVKIEGDGLPTAPIGNSDDLMVGEWVVAIGNPFAELVRDPQPTVTVGVVSALHRDVRPASAASGQTEGGALASAIYKDMIQTDAAINAGNSGGPLVNGTGEVVGINSFIVTSDASSRGVGFAIPVNLAGRVINELIEFGRVRDLWLGVGVQELTPTWAARLGIADADGALATFIEPDSPADRAGLRPGDIVVAIDDEPIATVHEARRAFHGFRVGDTITLTITRDGQAMRFSMKLEEAPR